jgi:hypothetical protein
MKPLGWTSGAWMLALILGLAAASRFSLTGKEVRVYVRIFYGRSRVAMVMGRGRPIGGGEGGKAGEKLSGAGPSGRCHQEAGAAKSP